MARFEVYCVRFGDHVHIRNVGIVSPNGTKSLHHADSVLYMMDGDDELYIQGSGRAIESVTCGTCGARALGIDRDELGDCS